MHSRVKKSKYDKIIVMDGDLHDSKYLPKMIKLF